MSSINGNRIEDFSSIEVMPGESRNGHNRNEVFETPVLRTQPHSPESEVGVLGCCLLAPKEVIGQCQEGLVDGGEEFYDLRHQEIYKAILKEFEEKNYADVITVQQRLKDSNMLDNIGGISYLASLPDSVPSAANLTYYLDIVKEKHILRKIIKVGTEMVSGAYGFEGTIEECMDSFERMALSVRPKKDGGELSVKELVKCAINQIEDQWNHPGQIVGLTTGFPDLDKVSGGLQPADFIVLSAFPSVGKTSLAMNIVEHMILDLGLPVGIFSLEMSGVSLVTRMLASRAKINMRNVCEGNMSEGDFSKITMAAGKIAKSLLYLADASDLSVYQMRSKARRWHQQYGIKFIVSDYLQLLNASGGSRKIENRQTEMMYVSGGCKGMAKELGIPVMVLSQLNEEGKIRDSRTPGQDADGVWELKRVKEYDDGEEVNPLEPESVDLWLHKQRNGPREQKVSLTFLKQFTRFESAAKIRDEDVQ